MAASAEHRGERVGQRVPGGEPPETRKGTRVPARYMHPARYFSARTRAVYRRDHVPANRGAEIKVPLGILLKFEICLRLSVVPRFVRRRVLHENCCPLSGDSRVIYGTFVTNIGCFLEVGPEKHLEVGPEKFLRRVFYGLKNHGTRGASFV